MTDQPDDARKRQQRGVFPPFFAPRNGGGRADGSAAAHSGSWRRVSRLFTPPEGAKVRRTPAVQQTPYTPPLTPAATPLATEWEGEAPETVAAEPVISEPVISEPATAESVAAESVAAAGPDLSPPPAELETGWPPAAPALEPTEESRRALEDLADPAFGDADTFTVESLETEPIALDASDARGLGAAVDPMEELASPALPDVMGESFASDAIYDEMYGPLPHSGMDELHAEAGHGDAEQTYAEVVLDGDRDPLAAYVEQPYATPEVAELPTREEAPAPAEVWDGQGLRVEGTPVVRDETPASPPESTLPASNEELEEPSIEADPWAGTELPEPAFGSLGWPSMDGPAAASKPLSDEADEMGAALAWNAGEAEDLPDAASPTLAGSPGGEDQAGDDAFSAVADELRDSSSAWRAEGSVLGDDYDDLTARARFYGGGDGGASRVEALAGDGVEAYEAARVSGTESSDHDVVRPGDDDSGAAIADALARVAARIRAGEVELPSGSVGVSDESALAAALAALLRGGGPRR